MDSLLIFVLIWIFSSLFNLTNKKNKKQPGKPWLPAEPRKMEPSAPLSTRSAKKDLPPIEQREMGMRPSYTPDSKTAWYEREPALEGALVVEDISLEGAQLIEGPSLEGVPLDQVNQPARPSLLLPHVESDRQLENWREAFTCCNQQDIVKGIMMAEILGPPLAKRKRK